MEKNRDNRLRNPDLWEEVWLMAGAAALVVFAHILFMLLSGKYLIAENPYNSYVRQACAWLQGRLSLPENCPWLELAVFGPPGQTEFYVSFPPLPSFLLLPLAALFGENAPDGLLAFFSMLAGVGYGVRLAGHFWAEDTRLSKIFRVMLPVFFYCASNLWQITVDAWVWFLAQNLSVTFTMASFWYGCQGKKGRAAFCLAAAVGCRPFQIVYTPLVCLMLLEAQKRRGHGMKWLFWEKDYRYIPAALLGGSYMLLNFLRFGSPWEFGHSYLPEFTRSAHGQFSLFYLKENLPSLFRLPEIAPDTGRWVFPMYDGCNIFLVNPILVVWIILILLGILRAGRMPKGWWLAEAVVVLSVLSHILALCCHKTMGGHHFGNRYVIDALPAVYLSVCRLRGKTGGLGGMKEPGRLLAGLGLAMAMLWGLLLNFWGTLAMYLGYS